MTENINTNITYHVEYEAPCRQITSSIGSKELAEELVDKSTHNCWVIERITIERKLS